MRGPSKSPPKYRKHKKSGQAIVTLSGKDFYLGPYGSKTSKQEYDRIVGEWLANGRCLQTGPDRVITVTELAAAYWNYAKGYYVKNGRLTDELGCVKMAFRHLKTVYGQQLVTEFGPLSLMALQDLMIKRGNCLWIQSAAFLESHQKCALTKRLKERKLVEKHTVH